MQTNLLSSILDTLKATIGINKYITKKFWNLIFLN